MLAICQAELREMRLISTTAAHKGEHSLSKYQHKVNAYVCKIGNTLCTLPKALVTNLNPFFSAFIPASRLKQLRSIVILYLHRSSAEPQSSFSPPRSSQKQHFLFLNAELFAPSAPVRPLEVCTEGRE